MPGTDIFRLCHRSRCSFQPCHEPRYQIRARHPLICPHTFCSTDTQLCVELRGMWRRAKCYSSSPKEALLRRRWHGFIFLSCSAAVAAVPVKIVRKPNLQEPEKINFTNFIFKQFLCTMVLLISHTITRDDIIKRLWCQSSSVFSVVMDSDWHWFYDTVVQACARRMHVPQLFSLCMRWKSTHLYKKPANTLIHCHCNNCILILSTNLADEFVTLVPSEYKLINSILAKKRIHFHLLLSPSQPHWAGASFLWLHPSRLYVCVRVHMCVHSLAVQQEHGLLGGGERENAETPDSHKQARQHFCSTRTCANRHEVKYRRMLDMQNKNRGSHKLMGTLCP